MPEASGTSSEQRSRRPRVGRLAETTAVTVFRRRRKVEGMSQRQYAREMGIPRSTLQHWESREAPNQMDAEIVAFFESPAGVVLLHRLLVAVHLSLCWMGSGGVRLACFFVTTAGLGPFIANSYGAQHSVAAEIQAALVAYDSSERARLQATMPARQITACEDETFLAAGMCLVAVEPVSGFVLLEKYAQRRDAETWKAALAEATAGMPVEVVQVTSDEAKALIRHAKDLGAHHSPDLFHVQHEVSQALSLPLHQRKTRAAEAVVKAEQHLEKQHSERDAYWKGPRGPGRPPDFGGRVAEAQRELAGACAGAAAAAGDWERWREHMRAIGDSYHPFDLASGERRGPEQLAAGLKSSFDGLREVARAAGLSERAHAGIEKAARVVPKMTATLHFYEERVRGRVEGLGLAPDHEVLLRDVILPATYLEHAARRRGAAERQRVRDTAKRLRNAVPADLPGELRTQLERVADLCAEEFQRSSSCVEGRNGRLAQYQHALRRLNPSKQAALTVIHNFLATRLDGTTAAERFFGAPPADLIEHLLRHVSVPARPARNRSRAKSSQGSS